VLGQPVTGPRFEPKNSLFAKSQVNGQKGTITLERVGRCGLHVAIYELKLGPLFRYGEYLMKYKENI